jgi:hypothetical protein
MQQPSRQYIYFSTSRLEQAGGMVRRRGFPWLGRSARLAQWEAAIRDTMQKLEQGGAIGSLDAPKHYVRGRVPLRWGPLKGAGAQDSGLIYFGGGSANTILGLVGSSTDILDSAGDCTLYSTSAGMPYLYAALKREVNIPFAMKHPRSIRLDDPQDYQKAVQAVRAATLQEQARGPALDVEICAQTLLIGAADPWNERPRVVLGVPLYVATIPQASASAR